MKFSLNRTVDVISSLVQKHVIINNKVKQNLLNQNNYQELKNKLSNLQKLIDSDNSNSNSMQIYKCAAVHEASESEVGGYLISGSSIDYLNGSYVFYNSYKQQNQTLFAYRNDSGAELCMFTENFQYMAPYIMRPNPDNSDLPEYQMPDCQAVLQGSETKLSDVTRWQNMNGDTVSFTLQELVTSGTSARWAGYRYDLNTKTFSDTLTEDLEYKMAAPIVGKIYNADTTIEMEYVPLARIPNENIILNYPMTDLKLNTNNGFLFTDGGVPELITDGIARLRINYAIGKLETQQTLLQGLSEFTVSVWVNFYTMPSGEKSWIFYESGYENYARALIDVNRDSNNHVGFHVRDTMTGDKGTWRSVYSNTVIQANKFYHIAVVYSAKEQSLYINGVLEYKGDGGTILTDSTSPSNGGITIGPDKPSTEDITHLRVFSKALNAQQISILYNELSRIVTE